VKQITIVVDDHPGVVADLSEALASRGINIESIDAEGADPHGVIHLTVDRYDEALVALRDAGFQAVSEDALVIRLRDEPGALARVAARFRDARLNIRSMRILRRDREFVLVTLVTSDNQQAREQLQDVLVG
jgi:hypothetical protein